MDTPVDIVFHGHACVELRAQGGTLLFDPFFRGPGQAGCPPQGCHPTDVLISHGHEDHLADAMHFASREDVTTLCNFEVGKWLELQGAKNVLGMNIGGVIPRPYGTVRMVAAQHSSTLPDGSSGGLAGGFLVDFGDWKCYHAGDTALTQEMELIGRFWKPDLALLPVGDWFTMGPEDALLAAHMLECREVIALHFDTFPPISLTAQRKADAVEAFSLAGKKLHFLPVGGQWQRAQSNEWGRTFEN